MDDSPNSEAKGNAGWWRSLLAAVFAAPLAMLLGARSSQVKVAQPALAPSEQESSSSASSSDCAAQFLAPIEAWAGERASVSTAKANDEVLVKGAFDAKGRFAASVEREKGGEAPRDDWNHVIAATRRLAAPGPGRTPAFPYTSVVIATIPDPIDSQLDYQFDTALDALRFGVEQDVEQDKGSQGLFYRDRAWLPWRDVDDAGRQRAASTKCRHSTPGMVLFRGGEPTSPSLRLLLLVGETPTSGVHRGAMLRALQLAAALSPDPTSCGHVCANGAQTCATAGQALATPTHACTMSPPPCTISIVGPAFSGGASSLRMAIMQWAANAGAAAAHPIDIVTGAATGSELTHILGANSGWPPPLSVRFASTTIPESSIECAYLHLVGRFSASSETPLRGHVPDVAMLDESGTAFGSSQRSAATDCDLAPGIRISFPVHIAALRSAYEDWDDRDEAAKETLIRPRALDLSLRENRVSPDALARPSKQTIFAQDMALGHALSRITAHRIRHVGIHATDVADAIFLARKIRDIAPDVRLAFFDNDALLLHPEREQNLLGSLVMGAYPFLGASSIHRAKSALTPMYDPFENGGAEGMFNAMLAIRGHSATELSEYVHPDDKHTMPVWAAAIGRTAFVPLSVSQSVDCTRAIFAASTNREIDRLCEGGRAAWTAYDESTALRVNTELYLPRGWHFLFVFLGLAFIADDRWQKRARDTLEARDPARAESAKEQESLAKPDRPKNTDLALGRAKWLLYAAIRTSVFALFITYMAILDILACATRLPKAYLQLEGWCYFAVAIASLVTLALRLYEFAKAHSALAHDPILESTGSLPTTTTQPTLTGRLLTKIGWGDADDNRETARSSLAQLRFLLVLVALLSSCGVLLEWAALLDGHLVVKDVLGTSFLPITRTAFLASGVSPAPPILLFMASTYAWTAGRMARLTNAHSIARVSPRGARHGLVSTPLTSILFPTAGSESDAPRPIASGEEAAQGNGAARTSERVPAEKSANEELEPSSTDAAAPGNRFKAIERALGNAIWRPIAGSTYVTAAALALAIPVLLLASKPLNTLEPWPGNWALGIGLCLSAFLVEVTLVQLVRYWLALEELLKRTMQHSIGRALATAGDFARDSVDEQLSRSPNDLLRLVSCSQLFKELLAARHASNGFRHDATSLDGLEQPMDRARDAALGASLITRADCAADLGTHVLDAAARVMQLLQAVLVPSSGFFRSFPRENRRAPDPSKGTPSRSTTHDALALFAAQFDEAELDWLQRCQAFVATVVALLISRYVRQFRYFLTSLTAGVVLLLLALSSYSFQPQRLLLTLSWALVVSVVGVGGWIFVQLDRNTAISFIAGTTPGKVTLDSALVVRAIAWAAIPLLLVAASTFPELANALYRVVDPFVRTLR